MPAPKVLVIGTGEYVTGLVHGSESTSDKGAGIVALTLFDLRERGLVSAIILAGSNGSKFPLVRSHFNQLIAERYEMDTSFRSFPDDDQKDSNAWKNALQELNPGDAVIIFTPDDLHYEMAYTAASKGLNVLVAKPIVKTIEEHDSLIEISREKKGMIAMEVHKRWDPIYSDAREKMRDLGEFSYFSSYMSQPKSQLDSFRDWAGKSSDISYYLNTHHIDFHCWALDGLARPISVIASSSTGFATSQGLPTEDSITLMVDWLNNSGTKATAVYTSSWIAAKAEVHSQQRFFALHHKGEVRIDQAHRGYDFASDAGGYQSPNPLFFRYTPDANGRFAGQSSYGYQSIADFILGKRETLATI
ncbi:Gfo/Idh/MocA family oxidoreductase, partial [Akkermansiaceae bacterium]|nr:Gfo/Idh/MocA family oxidoreductase [Akkermansiaceae bacterium]